MESIYSYQDTDLHVDFTYILLWQFHVIKIIPNSPESLYLHVDTSILDFLFIGAHSTEIFCTLASCEYLYLPAHTERRP